LRASSFGNIRVLYPMVSDTSDIFTFKDLLEESKKELTKENISFNEKIQEGIMIETPSAAIMSEKLLEYVDFANIGSNDLLQYTLASERGNAYTETRYHIMHPALIKLVQIIAEAGRVCKKEICLCGEIASFEEFYPLLVGVGVESFSVAISKFYDIKCHLLHLAEIDDSKIQEFHKLVGVKSIKDFFENDN